MRMKTDQMIKSGRSERKVTSQFRFGLPVLPSASTPDNYSVKAESAAAADR